MKYKSLVLSLLFLLTLCGYAFGLGDGIGDGVDIKVTNLTEFNTTTPVIMFYTENLTGDATPENCTLWYDNFVDARYIVAELNTTNATTNSFPATQALLNYQSGILEVRCNNSDAAVGEVGEFNITSDNYTIEVNGVPTNLTVTVNEDYTEKGGSKTFTVSWNDQNGTGGATTDDDVANVYVCSTSDFSYSDGCGATTWASTTGVVNTSTLTYSIPYTLAGGPHNFYAYITDDGGLTSNYYYSTFVTSAGMTEEEIEEHDKIIKAKVAAEAVKPEKKGAFSIVGYQVLGMVPVWFIAIIAIIFGVLYFAKKK